MLGKQNLLRVGQGSGGRQERGVRGFEPRAVWVGLGVCQPVLTAPKVPYLKVPRLTYHGVPANERCNTQYGKASAVFMARSMAQRLCVLVLYEHILKYPPCAGIFDGRDFDRQVNTVVHLRARETDPFFQFLNHHRSRYYSAVTRYEAMGLPHTCRARKKEKQEKKPSLQSQLSL